MKRVLLWFRNDLRTIDHPVLAGLEADVFLPVAILPHRYFGTTPYGFPKTGPYRAAFLIETLASLREELRNLGSDLLVASGDPGRIIGDLVEQCNIDEVWHQEEPGTEEAAEAASVERAVQGGPARIRTFHGQTLYHPEDISFDMPDIYTDFRKAAERTSSVRSPASPPAKLPPLPLSVERLDRDSPIGLPTVSALSGVDLPPVDPRAAMQFAGGQANALRRLEQYIWEQDLLKTYKETRNGLLGADYSSKLSPWLANGSLSARTIYQEVKRYESERVRNQSTYWLVFELIWRDYFWFLMRRYGSRMFALSGPMRRYRTWRDDELDFERWRLGRTGEPFIDANMRELAATGYMSNRGRQNVASYLARDLQVNWLWGAEYFESVLVDYDPASNYGNWTYTVGVGTDPRLDRSFDPRHQAAQYDPSGAFRRHWLA